MRVVITRPIADASPWVNGLQTAGHQVLVLPLIDIGSPSQTQPILHAWRQWSTFQAVMFVSAQAVRYFFKFQPIAMRTGLFSYENDGQTPRCWATGPGTRGALLQAGVPEALIDSPPVDATQFDSEALWQCVRSKVKVGQPVLIVRGHDVSLNMESEAHGISREGSGRDWLALQLQAVGAPVCFVVVYERHSPVWTVQQVTQAVQAATDGSVWCFSSSQALQYLRQVLPRQSWAQTRCITTHSRIAQTARALNFGEIHTSRPSLADVLSSLESLS